MITTIDLNYSQKIYPLISQELVDLITKTLEEKKRVLVFLNRRWESSALICKDCWYHVKCSDCDITLHVHKYPSPILICHQCNRTEDIPNICPKCKGANLIQVGIWIQKMEDNLAKIFPTYKINRLDSDKIKKEWIFIDDVKNSDIIIATEIANTLSFDNLWLIVFPLFEAEMLSWEYNIEEKIYINIAYNSKRWADILIQTYTPNNRILQIITEWNYKDFLIETLAERKKFLYPPYSDFVYIWIKWKNKDRVTELLGKFANKLSIMNEWWDKIISFDKNNFIKKFWEFYQKIMVRWVNIQEFLEPMKLEIIRNREIEMEWK